MKITVGTLKKLRELRELRQVFFPPVPPSIEGERAREKEHARRIATVQARGNVSLQAESVARGGDDAAWKKLKTTPVPQTWMEFRKRVARALANDEISDLGYEGEELSGLYTVWQWVEDILKDPEMAQEDWDEQGPHMVYSALVDSVDADTAKKVAAAVAGTMSPPV